MFECIDKTDIEKIESGVQQVYKALPHMGNQIHVNNAPQYENKIAECVFYA